MSSVRWNSPSSFTCDYVGGSTGVITLSPGVNIGIDDDELTHFLKHPVVKAKLEEGLLDVLTRTPVITQELEGFDVVDDKATGQPIPVQPASKTGRPIKGQAVAENLAKLSAEQPDA